MARKEHPNEIGIKRDHWLKMGEKHFPNPNI